MSSARPGGGWRPGVLPARHRGGGGPGSVCMTEMSLGRGLPLAGDSHPAEELSAVLRRRENDSTDRILDVVERFRSWSSRTPDSFFTKSSFSSIPFSSSLVTYSPSLTTPLFCELCTCHLLSLVHRPPSWTCPGSWGLPCLGVSRGD